MTREAKDQDITFLDLACDNDITKATACMLKDESELLKGGLMNIPLKGGILLVRQDIFETDGEMEPQAATLLERLLRLRRLSQRTTRRRQ